MGKNNFAKFAVCIAANFIVCAENYTFVLYFNQLYEETSPTTYGICVYLYRMPIREIAKE
jgi:hypothetical protein